MFRQPAWAVAAHKLLGLSELSQQKVGLQQVIVPHWSLEHCRSNLPSHQICHLFRLLVHLDAAIHPGGLEEAHQEYCNARNQSSSPIFVWFLTR